MSERDSLVEALVAEVLGPREGPTERMTADTEDPLDEYIVGVLAPESTLSVELDSDEELAGESESAAEDEADPGTVVPGSGSGVASLPSLVLDPMSRPASMGISLAVESPSVPTLDLCCTWARYGKTEGSWERRPYGVVWRSVDCSTTRSLTDPSDPAVRLEIRSREDARSGVWRVSLFLVNGSLAESDRPKPQDHVFQPQIRVRCHGDSRLVPVERSRPAHDPEEEGLDLLYGERPVLARGHLCSALWEAVDPERPHSGGLRGTRAPFVWTDGRHLFDNKTAAEFEAPHARSEFVPVVPVNAPNKSWREDWGEAPELNPLKLAELSDGVELREALTPLADGYGRWIDALAGGEDDVLAANPALQRHVAGCRGALERVRDGIEVLATDHDARMAFCFANRAIALQSRWTKGKVNPWWPFQLAFQLINIRAVVEEAHPDRNVCDLLWFPTGGGKTEAYLGLAAFTLAHRRLRALRERRPDGGSGVAVLSRYTLRLLTIQQYRRALALVTACEFLRTTGTPRERGWRPTGWKDAGDLPWGTHRFSIGLWVGGGVTPNNLHDFAYRDSSGKHIPVFGALSILSGKKGEGEPAQILNCPSCRAVLAIPSDGLAAGETVTLHLVLGEVEPPVPAEASQLSQEPFEVLSVEVTPHAAEEFATVSLTFRVGEDVPANRVDTWFGDHVLRNLFANRPYLVSARATRPGYFVRSVMARKEEDVEFELFCPNPHCDLNTDVVWDEQTHAGPWPVPEAFDRGDGTSTRCPIPAWTVDEQIYARCPSMIIATVDKFARLAYEPRAAAIFGNVDKQHEYLGYYRTWVPPSGRSGFPVKPRENPTWGRSSAIGRLRPPELILQDELHLIEGPLGSMVGLYETGIDLLATTRVGDTLVRPKYIASTATVRQAEEQVQSLFARDLQVFPPPGARVDDSFFSWGDSGHPLDSDGPGRLYVGLVAPGRGAQTPLVRAWSRLLQEPLERLGAGASERSLDPFWTLVGYFNAIRELAGAVALVRQDIVQRLNSIAGDSESRTLSEHLDPMELSSRADSLRLPRMLEDLGKGIPDEDETVSVVVATSMFGTGVDVDRLGLMFVNGQPKTTSAYIQATGRVGRSTGGLVVTFYRASRPRDLSHYEYFAGYHHTLYRHVEPVTVNPFAPRARDRALGPLAVSLLRQAARLEGPEGTVAVDSRWRVQQRIKNGWYCRADEMSSARTEPDVELVPELLEIRAAEQPVMRRPQESEVAEHMRAELDRWRDTAEQHGGSLLFHESTVTRPASSPVVLGDLAHHVAGTDEVFENAPNSLREVEATTSVRGRG
ncbi:helicase [Thermobifida halotolerans]|uniref:Helicase n=1 Tax=Thermobifida halotolerans TaxID=483545 RepID=A0A399FXT1_9ACTN|nr:DISARM system helicase DrmA [Thermobifida halotolerans]UOE18858.1 helicase [Thermobifida halotolerans]